MSLFLLSCVQLYSLPGLRNFRPWEGPPDAQSEAAGVPRRTFIVTGGNETERRGRREATNLTPTQISCPPLSERSPCTVGAAPPVPCGELATHACIRDAGGGGLGHWRRPSAWQGPREAGGHRRSAGWATFGAVTRKQGDFSADVTGVVLSQERNGVEFIALLKSIL